MPKKLKAKGIEQGIFDAHGFSAPILENPEAHVRFSLRHCDTDDYCLSRIANSEEAAKLNKRLGYLEDHEWRQITNKPREDGISIEKKDSANHRSLKERFSQFNTFGHFRVNGIQGLGTYRIFGARDKDLFYILMIDRQGDVNHS